MNKNSTCPKCGAPMNFCKEEYTLVCPYCDTTIRIEKKPEQVVPVQPIIQQAPQITAEEQINNLTEALRREREQEEEERRQKRNNGCTTAVIVVLVIIFIVVMFFVILFNSLF